MKNKTYFIIAYIEGQGILIFKKKMLEQWELPKISSSKEKPINELVEQFFKNHLKGSYKIIGQSEVVDSYEWPKELQNITGKDGEEHRFIFVEIRSKLDKDSIKSEDYSGYDLVDYDLLVEKVIFKNHKTVLKKVLADLDKMKKNKK